jgi:thiosulfate/3-mercaptopyruvate sulfurtransferase
LSDRSSFFITPQALSERIGNPKLRVVDGAWYLPAQKRHAKAEFAAGHIPGAVFLDQDAVVEPGVALPHALPSPQVFADAVGAMGIAADDEIIVHDGPGLFSAPRVWWLFRIMGAENVRILEGGLDRWTREGRALTQDVPPVTSARFVARFDEAGVVRFEEMLGAVAEGSRQIADARPSGRFTGREPEPRAGMRSGHMPGARNVPAASLVRDGTLISDHELRALFQDAGIDVSQPVITSCGSGVTAAALVLALEVLGRGGNRLYDGSWAQWGGRDDTPVVNGPA